MVQQLRLLSGRFRVGSLLRHFSPGTSGVCELCGQELEDLPHLVLHRCPLLLERRNILYEYAIETLKNSEVSLNIFKKVFSPHTEEDIKVQFLLDCSVLAEVISTAQ